MFVPFRTSADYFHPHLCHIRGMINATETPIRQAVLPDLSVHLNTSQVSYHSFIINICRSIGPAIAGLILSIYHAPFTFLAQSMCYFIAVLLCIPLTFKTVGEANKANKGFHLRLCGNTLRIICRPQEYLLRH